MLKGLAPRAARCTCAATLRRHHLHPCLGHHAAPDCGGNGAGALLHIPPWKPHTLSPHRFYRCHGAGPPPKCRATAIADVPWREPTSSATAAVPGLPDFHHTKSEGQALSVSLVKPGAYLSASYERYKADHLEITRLVNRLETPAAGPVWVSNNPCHQSTSTCLLCRRLFDMPCYAGLPFHLSSASVAATVSATVVVTEGDTAISPWMSSRNSLTGKPLV
jgi:hypothetical protein